MSATSKLAPRLLAVVLILGLCAVGGLGQGRNGGGHQFKEPPDLPRTITADNKKKVAPSSTVTLDTSTKKALANSHHKSLVKVDPNKKPPPRLVTTRTKKEHKPFAMVDPTSRANKPVKGDHLITTRSGKKVKAADYYAELNAMEKYLNDRGHSLRDKPRGSSGNKPDKVQLQRNDSKKALQDQRAAKQKQLHRKINRELLAATLAQRLREAAYRETLAEDVELLEELAKKLKAAKIADHQSWTKQLGNHESVGLDLEVRAGYEGTSRQLKGWVKASADAWLWNNKQNLIQADVSTSMNLPDGRPVNRTSLKILGQDVTTALRNLPSKLPPIPKSKAKAKAKPRTDKPKAKSPAKGRTRGEYKDYSQTIDHAVEFRYVVGPVPVRVRLGIHGTVGMTYEISHSPTDFASEVTPNAQVDVYVQAGINAWLLEVGVGSDLTLIQATVKITSGAGFTGVASDGPYFSYLSGYLDIENDVTALSGRVYVYLDINYFFGHKHYEWEIFGWNGLRIAKEHLYHNDKREYPLLPQFRGELTLEGGLFFVQSRRKEGPLYWLDFGNDSKVENQVRALYKKHAKGNGDEMVGPEVIVTATVKSIQESSPPDPPDWDITVKAIKLAPRK